MGFFVSFNIYNNMEKYSDNMLIKYLKWVKTLDLKSLEINLSSFYDFQFSSNSDILFKPFGNDDQMTIQFVYSLLDQNLDRDFEKNLIRPKLKSYTVTHKIRVRRVLDEVWEGNLESYLPTKDVDGAFVQELEAEGDYYWWDGDLIETRDIDDDILDGEIYDIEEN